MEDLLVHILLLFFEPRARRVPPDKEMPHLRLGGLQLIHCGVAAPSQETHGLFVHFSKSTFVAGSLLSDPRRIQGPAKQSKEDDKGDEDLVINNLRLARPMPVVPSLPVLPSRIGEDGPALFHAGMPGRRRVIKPSRIRTPTDSKLVVCRSLGRVGQKLIRGDQ